MTYSDSNRLNRIEALVESNSQKLAQVSQTAQFVTSAQLELARLVDTVVQRVNNIYKEQVTQDTENLTPIDRRLTKNMERLTVLEERIAEQQAFIDAVVKRWDRILDDLMRRDGER